MKRLKFRKWVTYTLTCILCLAMFLLSTVIFENLTTEIIFATVCLLVVYINGILLSMYS